MAKLHTRIPNKEVIFFTPETKAGYQLPFLSSYVQAGFPSPADDHVHKKLDLNELLIAHPAATFFMRVEGESMVDAGIQPGDIVIVDRAVTPMHNQIVIAFLNGELAIKRIVKKGEHTYLHSENKAFEPIQITQEMDFELWGVVTYIIHRAQ